MKGIAYRVTFACLAVLLGMNACVIGEIADRDEYASHKLIYEYSESAVYEMLYSLNLSVSVNAYATATSDSARNAIRKAYFPSARIGQTSDGWTVGNEHGEWLFESNGLPIDQEGAEWKIGLSRESGRYKLISPGDFVIKAVGNRKWQLQLNNVGSGITDRLYGSAKYDYYFDFRSSGTYAVAASEPDSIQPFFYDYTILNGKGGFVPNKKESGHYNIVVDYEVGTPLDLRYDTSEYIFSDGSILFHVVDSDDASSESFKAVVNTVPGNWNVSFK
jgi:hypothetical protein